MSKPSDNLDTSGERGRIVDMSENESMWRTSMHYFVPRSEV
jgi:hypothetical protein